MDSASMSQNDYFECDCASKEHTFCVTSEESEDQLPPQLYFYFQLIQYRGFAKRLWVALKYVFKYQCRYGHWDTVNLSEDDTNRLIILLHQHRAKLYKFSGEREKTNERTTAK
jgi:hypothetical protein